MNKNKLIDTENRMLVTRGEREGKDEEGKEGSNIWEWKETRL